jgi:hypothetical protein
LAFGVRVSGDMARGGSACSRSLTTRPFSNGARTGLALAIEQHADFVLGRLTSVEKVTAFRIFQAAWSLATL